MLQFLSSLFLVFFSMVASITWAATSHLTDNIATPSVDIGRLDLNTVDAETLTKKIKGLGKKRAEAIIADREQYGPFTSLRDLARVVGVTRAFVNKYYSEISKRFYVQEDS